LKLSSFVKHPYLTVVLIINLIPFYGVFKLGWSISEIIILYWWDVGIVALFALLASAILLNKYKERKKKIYKETKFLNFYFLVFFALSIGLFVLSNKADILNFYVSAPTALMMLVFFASRGVTAMQNFRDYKTDPVKTARDQMHLVFPNFLTLMMFSFFIIILITEDIASVGNIAAYIATIFLLIVRLVIDLVLEEDALNKKKKI